MLYFFVRKVHKFHSNISPRVLIMKNFFSFLGSFATITILCLAVSVIYRMDAFSAALFTSVGWFCYGKFVLAMSFTQGYGVKGMKTVLGMPLFIAALLTIVGSIVASLLMMTYRPSTLLPETIANLRAFGWSAASGVAVAVCHWYSYARRAYFYQSEYNIRVECKDRNDSPEVTKATVARYRSIGIVR